MKMLMALMLALVLPLLLVAEDGWRSWADKKTSTTRSASNIDWLPDATAVKAKTVNPIADVMNEGFPPRSAALAAKENEAVKTGSPPVKETPVELRYEDVPVYDRRGRLLRIERRQVIAPANEPMSFSEICLPGTD